MGVGPQLCELPRTTLLGSSVNKGIRKGRSLLQDSTLLPISREARSTLRDWSPEPAADSLLYDGWCPFTTRQNGVPHLAVLCDLVLVLVKDHRVLSGTTVDY